MAYGYPVLHTGADTDAIVFDIGSYSIRFGYAGSDLPLFDIPTFVGRAQGVSDPKSRICIGEVKLCHPRSGLELSAVANNFGEINDWDLLEKVLDYAYNDCFKVDSSEHPVMFTEPALNPISKQERICELMFERYRVPAFYLAKTPALSLLAAGKTSGLVVDVGHSGALIAPVDEGCVYKRAVVSTPVGGQCIMQQVKQSLPAEQLIPKQLLHAQSSELSIHPSQREFIENLLVADVVKTIGRVNYNSTAPVIAERSIYEFPNGNQRNFSKDGHLIRNECR